MVDLCLGRSRAFKPGTLDGGRGSDRLAGGMGSDRFAGGQGKDVAVDFNRSEGDSQNGTVP